MSETVIPTVESAQTVTFTEIFFSDGCARPIRVPDYQRAFSWKQKQIDLFIEDLRGHGGCGSYYFGHFIAENLGSYWEIVDGQQRITMFILFLMVCRALSDPLCEVPVPAFSLIERFTAVSYDDEALRLMRNGLHAFLSAMEPFDDQRPPSDDKIATALSLKKPFTLSQIRMAMALLRFNHAFQKGRLEKHKIQDYIAVIMNADCSLHLTRNKSVAVNIFEMHNTRGMPLTPLEIVKAVLMKFVFDNSDADSGKMVEEIQSEFGEIYGMEERMAASAFRGKMTIEHALRLHLRAVDDGSKGDTPTFDKPGSSANSDDLINYVNTRLRFADLDKHEPREPAEGVRYALRLVKEFKKSLRIISEHLPAWDDVEQLVGDVLILERDLSCQFFLIVCRRLEREHGKADGRLSRDTLVLWERLLFTRDFHGQYHNLWYRDNFPALWSACYRSDETQISSELSRYLRDGFRPEKTSGLQDIVDRYIQGNRNQILNNAFYWWKTKMIYVLYKYEVAKGANVRQVMKGSPSVEHMLPQDLNRIRSKDVKLDDMKEPEWKAFHEQIDSCINGVGNLLLITQAENTSQGNKHPAEKDYGQYHAGGSIHAYKDRWRSHEEWPKIIRERGEEILAFMRSELVGMPASAANSPVPASQVASGGLG